MSNTCIVLRDIENVSQIIADFLSNPGLLTPASAADLVNQIELINGSVRSLPLAAVIKNDILGRLLQAQIILQTNATDPLSVLLSVLQILQIAASKVKNNPVPCTGGLTIVHPSNCFSTSCQCCQ